MKLRFAVALFLTVVVVSYCIFLLIMMPISVSNYGAGYFMRYYFPKILPFAIFALYLLNNPEENTVAKIISICLVAFAALGFTIFSFGLATNIQVSFFLGAFNWSYVALIEYSLAFLLLFTLAWRKTHSHIFSAAFSLLATSAMGLIYELPIYPIVPTTDIYFHEAYPLFIATKWFSLLFLGYLAWHFKWKLNSQFFFAFWIYLMFSMIFAVHPRNFLPVWLPRLPALFMLTAIPSGLRVKP